MRGRGQHAYLIRERSGSNLTVFVSVIAGDAMRTCEKLTKKILLHQKAVLTVSVFRWLPRSTAYRTIEYMLGEVILAFSLMTQMLRLSPP